MIYQSRISGWKRLLCRFFCPNWKSDKPKTNVVNYSPMKQITLKQWLSGKAPKGTIYTGTKQPYMKTPKGVRYDVAPELAREIEKRRAVL